MYLYPNIEMTLRLPRTNSGKRFRKQGKMLVNTDFNSRMGTKDIIAEMLGRFGEETINSNARRIIKFCQINNLVSANSFFSTQGYSSNNKSGKK